MELATEWADLGLWGLFLASFLSATILPFSSEAVLGAMALGSWSFSSLWFIASVGNTLGGLTNYALGRWIPKGKLLGRLRVDPTKVARWKTFVTERGVWAALLCWLPVIGDPIAIALGLFRAPVVPCVLLMFVGKAGRYAAVLLVARSVAHL